MDDGQRREAEQRFEEERNNAERDVDEDPIAVQERISRGRRFATKAGLEDIAVLCALTEAHFRGEYRIQRASLFIALGAIFYALEPIDAIPDIVPAVGYSDDALIVAVACAQLKFEIENFKAWEERHGHIRNLVNQFLLEAQRIIHLLGQ